MYALIWVSPHYPTATISVPGRWQRRHLRSFYERRQAAPRRASLLSAFSLYGGRSCAPRLPPTIRAVSGAASASAAACHRPTLAPAVAVERLGNALGHAPFHRPATVRGRVCGRIGPLVHRLRQCEQNRSLSRSQWARERDPSHSPIQPYAGSALGSAAAAQGPLLPHADRAALVWRFAAKRRSIVRTTGPTQRHASTR